MKLRLRPRRWIRIMIGALLAFMLFAVCVAVWLPGPLLSIAESRLPGAVFRGPRSSGLIALTIDDGPHPDTTMDLLATLERHEAQATFFLLGENVIAYPDLVDSIRIRGHEIGNHLMRDERSVTKGRDQFVRDLTMADSLLALSDPKWFRPGSGWTAGWMIEEATREGYTCILASAYVQDVKLRNGAVISQLLKWRVGPGDIVVLHEGDPSRTWAPRVLDQLIPYWRSKGWKVGTVGQLMR